MSENEEKVKRKKYRAYLTRLSKWEAQHQMNSDRHIGVDYLRRVLKYKGELLDELGDDWAKRVFKGEMFEDIGNGFYKVVEDERWERPPPLDSRPKWEGVRPGEDVVTDALYKTVEAFKNTKHIDLRLDFRSRLESESWIEVTRAVHVGFRYARRRGLAKPMYPMAERAFMADEFHIDGGPALALWFMDSISLVDSFQRLRAHLKDGSPLFSEMLIYQPWSWQTKLDDDGKMMIIDEEMTPQVALREVSRLMARRGLLPKKKRPAK